MLGGGDAIRTVNLYYTDGIELATLSPIGRALEGHGMTVQATDDFSAPADIALYACHSNLFFDFEEARWNTPPGSLRVICLHDLGQSNGDEDYFFHDSWQVFDLGLLPGPRWESYWQRSMARGIHGPRLGVRSIGWPKFDHVWAEPARFAQETTDLRARLGLPRGATTVLLACSYSDRRQLTDALALVDAETSLVVKYPPYPPPPSGYPWSERLREARQEMLDAKALAGETPGVVVADDDLDIYALLAVADVVVSNGSNVLYEAVLMEKPAVSVRDWMHPTGPSGDDVTPPRVDLDGVLSVGASSLRVAVDAARALPIELLRAASEDLAPRATRGEAARRAAMEVLAAIESDRSVPTVDEAPRPAPVRDTEIRLLRESVVQLRGELASTRAEAALLRDELDKAARRFLRFKNMWWAVVGRVAPKGSARGRAYLRLRSALRRSTDLC